MRGDGVSPGPQVQALRIDVVSGATGKAFGTIGLLSALALGGLIWLLYVAVPAQPMPDWARQLPACNATFNGISALIAWLGWLAVRRGRTAMHKVCMLLALAASAAFLVGYIVYHHYHGDTLYGGQGWWRLAYFFLLISHVSLSMLLLPLLLSVVWFALSGQLDRHRRLARWVWPLWMYVSTTGVLVYGFLRPFY